MYKVACCSLTSQKLKACQVIHVPYECVSHFYVCVNIRVCMQNVAAHYGCLTE